MKAKSVQLGTMLKYYVPIWKEGPKEEDRTWPPFR